MQSFDYGDPYKPYTKPETAGLQSFGAIYPDAPKDQGIVAPLSSAGKFLARSIPFSRYAFIKEDNEAFARMSDSQKITALTMETVMAGVFVTAPFMFTAAKGAIGGTARAVGKARLKPMQNFVEDIATYQSKSYTEQLSAKLASDGFTEAENVGIRNYLRGGGPPSLKKVALQQAKTGTSKPWKDSIIYSGDFASPGGGLSLEKAIRKSLSPTSLQREAVKNKWSGTLKMSSVLGEYEAGTDVQNAILQNQLRRYYGKDLAATKTLKNASSKEIAAATADILRSPAIARRTISPEGFVNLKPVQVVLGAGDRLFGTFRNVLRPTEEALGNTNREALRYTLLLQTMAQQRGLGTIKTTEKAGKIITSFIPNKQMLDAGVRDTAKATLESVDGMLGALHKLRPNDPMKKQIVDRTLAEVAALKSGQSDGSKALMEVTYSFNDKLYGDRMKSELSRIISQTPLTETGVVTADRMLNTFGADIEQIFGTGYRNNYPKKIAEIDRMLGSLKKNISPHIMGSKNELKTLQNTFMSELTFQSPGGGGKWLNYSDHYIARLYEGAQGKSDDVLTMLRGDMKPFFTKPRELGEGVLPQVDWETMMGARISAHVKELHLYPTMSEVARNSQTLPGKWQELIGHYYSRLLNIPSGIDHGIADVMTRTVGKMERVLGKAGVWDGYRVSRLASTINDGVYTGIVGLNPFSAGRNTLQPFLNVAADFGGISNYPKLLRQYAKLGDKETWAVLNKVGVFTDYAPELTQKSAMLGLGKKVGPFTFPRSDKVRDFSMWAFHSADRVNRFVTGSAALDDWTLAAVKFPGAVEGKSINSFMNKVGTKHTQPWIQTEVEYFLRNKQFNQARDVFIKAKVGDTQYLYGSLYSPIVSQTYGAFGKTGVVFHSWWMNYGQLVKKWMTTGSVDARSSRLFAWMTSSAMMYTAMEPIWGDYKAMQSVLFGPFPGFKTAKNVMEGRTSKIPDANLDLISGVSPVWRVPVEFMRMAAQAGSLLIGVGEDDKSYGQREKAAMAQLNSFRKSITDITIPGAVTIEKMLTEAHKGPIAAGKAAIGIPKFR